MDFLLALDRYLFHIVNSSGQPWFDPWMLFVSSGSTWLFVGSAFLILYMLGKKDRPTQMRMMFFLGLAIALSDSVSYRIIKPLVQRLRPCYQEETFRLVTGSCGSEFGFTSNHAANAMAIALTLALMLRKKRLTLILLLIAAIVGLSRIYLGVHYPGDVLGGYLVGAAISYAIYKTQLFWYNRKKTTTLD